MKVTLVKIEDHEGTGECSACPKKGLRWVATMSDGMRVGLECAKKIMGYKITPDNYKWTADFVQVAEHRSGTDVYVLWTRKDGKAKTVGTQNGVLYSVGGTRKEWIADGWL